MTRAELADGTKKPPLYRYGFPFTFDFVFRYAAKKGFKLEIPPDARDIFDGKEVIDCVDITEELLDDDERWLFLYWFARVKMFDHLNHKCDWFFDGGRPFSNDWDEIMSPWSNYTIKERYHSRRHFNRMMQILEEEMNLCQEEGKQSKAQWWFDWDNNVVSTPASR